MFPPKLAASHPGVVAFFVARGPDIGYQLRMAKRSPRTEQIHIRVTPKIKADIKSLLSDGDSVTQWARRALVERVTALREAERGKDGG